MSKYSMRTYHLERCEERYEKIRMAVFDPLYLHTHQNWDEEDFTKLIDEIVRLQEIALDQRQQQKLT